MKIKPRFTLVLFALLFILGLVLGAAPTSALAIPKGLALDETRHLAFSAVGGAVIVIDVANPGSPVLLSDSIQTQGVVQDLDYDSAHQRLYIAADEGDLEIWDLQNPSAPQQISVTPLYYFGVETPAVSVAVVGDVAYVSTGWGYLHWLDVTDPAQPVDFGFNGIGGNPSREVFAAADGFVYLAGPDTVRYAINGDGSLSLAGQNIYATSYELFAAGGYVYISTGTGPFQILDAGQPGLPFVSTTSTNNIKDIFVSGSYAYIANGVVGLRVLDVTDKSAPYEIGFDDSAGATDVVVANNLAYVRAGSTLRVVDVSAPGSPVVLGTFDASGGGVGNIAPIANAGLAQAVPARTLVTLDGSASYDTDGTITAYAWTQLSGPAVQLDGAQTAAPTFKAPRVRRNQVATLVFELTVTDDDGATGSDQVQVAVFPH